MREKPRPGPARAGHTYLPKTAMDNNCLDTQLEDFVYDEDLRIRRVIVVLESGEDRLTR
jgi:hypothetical protein